MRMLRAILPALFLTLLTACSGDDAQSEYSKYRAALSLTGIETITPLRNALGSFGEYCTVTADLSGKYFQCSTLHSSQRVNRTGADAYHVYTCIAGFIIGRSSLTEIGTGNYPLLCFDLACPNCYADDGISRALSLKEGGLAYCSRCKRTYDINDRGIVSDGKAGRKLERYHIIASASALMVTN